MNLRPWWRITPVEALELAIDWAFLVSRPTKQPGAVIEKLPKEIRAQLENLTSDETRNMRIK